MSGLDASSQRRPNPVSALFAILQGLPSSVAESSIDGNGNRDALDQRVPGLFIGGQPTLDTPRLEEQGKAAAVGVPQFGIHREENTMQRLTVVRAANMDSAGDPSLAHRSREVDVHLQLVDRQLIRAGVD